MTAIAIFYHAHPFWSWIAFAAALLAAEVASGWGYLLWPALAAVLIALFGRMAPFGFPLEAATFALLSAVLIVTARTLAPRRRDRPDRLVGCFGETLCAFTDGRGRALIEGAEWAAELESPAESPAPGARVRVVAMVARERVLVRVAPERCITGLIEDIDP